MASTTVAAPRATAVGASRADFIDIEDLSVVYRTRSGEDFVAAQQIDLQVREGEFFVIVGPSGCGKSTLLKVLAGLLPASAGSARIDGRSVAAPREDIGLVFQNATLLPWLSILENIMLPLKVQRRGGREQREERARYLLELVGLSAYAKHYPKELSGGMQQRIGIARALAHDPSLLLMDEPFGALDAMTRETMSQELQRIWMAQSKTVVFVTHSISEAVFLADRIVVMSPHPGTIAAQIDVDLPRPRGFETIDSARFTEISRQVRAHLYGKGTA